MPNVQKKLKTNEEFKWIKRSGIMLVSDIFDLFVDDLDSGLDLERDTCDALIDLLKSTEMRFNEKTA